MHSHACQKGTIALQPLGFSAAVIGISADYVLDRAVPARGVPDEVRDVAFGVFMPCQIPHRIIPTLASLSNGSTTSVEMRILCTDCSSDR